MTLGVLFALLAGIGWGISAVVVRSAIRYLPNPALGALISLFAGAFFLIPVALIGYWKEVLHLSLLALPWFALLGFLNSFLGRRFNFMSIQRAGVARAAPIIGTSPLLASSMAVLFIGETLTVPLFLGILAVVGGVALITGTNPQGQGTRGQDRLWVGYAFAFTAALCYATASLITRMAVRQLAPPVVVATFALTFGTVFLFLSLVPTLPKQMPMLRNSRRGILLFALSGTITDFAMTSNYTALSLAPVVVVTPITSANALVALILSYFFLKQSERITPRVALGALLIIGGVVLVSLSQALTR